MYEAHFGLSERPFSIAPDPQYLYMSAQHKEAMAHLSYGVAQGGGFILLTGEVGTGKTTLCRNLLKRLPDDVDVALILNADIQKSELLQTICDELAIKYKKTDSQKTLLNLLNKYLLDSFAGNRKTVLIIDEAQLLSRDVLEQIRLLTNLETTKTKLLQIILIGQPELNDLLRRQDLRQLAQRVTARYHLNSIQRDDMTEYVNYRLKVAGCTQALFTKQALNKIYRITKGIPRLINVLCDHSLLVAYAQNCHLVDTRLVKQAANEMMLEEKRSLGSMMTLPWVKPLSMAAALAIVAGVLLWWLPAANTDLQGSQDTVSEQPLEANNAAESDVLSESSVLPSEPLSVPADELTESNETDSIADNSVLDAESQSLAVIDPNLMSDNSSQETHESTVGQEQIEKTVLLDAPVQDAVGRVIEASDLSGSSLSDLLNREQANTSRVQAFRSMSQLWGRPLPQLLLNNFCQEVRDLKLDCLFGEGTLSSVAQYNRPVILVLNNDTGLHRVILKGFDQTDAVVQIGSQDHHVSVAELQSLWTSSYLLYWQPPEIGYRLFVEGMVSPSVVWLRQQIHFALLQNNKSGLDNTVSPTYDAELAQVVRGLQQDYGMPMDGQVGIQTFMLLNEMLQRSDIPKLQPVESMTLQSAD